MAVLDIDMGNTRTKWRCGDATGALPAPELPRPAAAPERVRVATVLGNRPAIAGAVKRRFGVEAEFAATSASLAGVRCGYDEPGQLGVDRWLAAVAAWQRVRDAVAVVSVGTAATVDAVDTPVGATRTRPSLVTSRNLSGHSCLTRSSVLFGSSIGMIR